MSRIPISFLCAVAVMLWGGALEAHEKLPDNSARLKTFHASLEKECAEQTKNEEAAIKDPQLCVITAFKETLEKQSGLVCPDADPVHCYLAIVDHFAANSPLNPQLQLRLLEAGMGIIATQAAKRRKSATLSDIELEADGVLWLIEVLLANGEAFVRNPACKGDDADACRVRREGLQTIVERSRGLFPPTGNKERDAVMRKAGFFPSLKEKHRVLSGLTFYELGIALHDSGDYEGAIQRYTEALTADPKSYPAYYSRGTARFEQKNYRGAISDYTEAIKIHPKSARSYFFRAVSQWKLGRLANAEKDLAEARRLDAKLTADLEQRFARTLAGGR